jgi:uncharacterized protein DUF4124
VGLRCGAINGRSSVVLVVCLLTVTPFSSNAEIYRWVDENGEVHYTDKKPQERSAETVDIQTPDVKAPDAGELRRRALLEETEDHFATDTHAPSATTDEFFSAPVDDNNQSTPHCAQARIRYGVLNEQMPIYLTTYGELRPAWSNDTYRGERSYVADEDRPGLVNQALLNMRKHCTDPGNQAKQEGTYALWEHEQWCDAFRVRIDVAGQSKSRTPRDVLKRMQDEFDRDC